MAYKLLVKSQENWGSKVSGDLNKLNTFCLFETDNEYGFPEVKSSANLTPADLLMFHMSKKKLASDRDKTISFFIDDYKFEPLWSCPQKYIELLRFYEGMISPTFSIWDNQPYALNLFNMYRSRWCTRFFQENGVKVLVDVRWAGEDSYDYCFSGIEKGSAVVLNTVGTYNLENRALFVKGFEPMLRAIEPEKLYVYGEYLPLEFQNYVDKVVVLDSFWKKRREVINGRREE